MSFTTPCLGVGRAPARLSRPAHPRPPETKTNGLACAALMLESVRSAFLSSLKGVIILFYFFLMLILISFAEERILICYVESEDNQPKAQCSRQWCGRRWAVSFSWPDARHWGRSRRAPCVLTTSLMRWRHHDLREPPINRGTNASLSHGRGMEGFSLRCLKC